eukprot:3838896-Pyramimonas_sp.AAC.1
MCIRDRSPPAPRSWCLRHQLHLIVQKQVGRRGRSDKYFSYLAMFVNTWRACGHAKLIRAAWEEVNPDRAGEVCRRLPPRPLKGRWCSTPGAEEA